MKKLIKLFIALIILFSTGVLFAQNSPLFQQNPFVNGTTAEIGPMCVGGIVYDDNSFENAYSVSGNNQEYGMMVMKITPPVYPFKINQLCFVLMRHPNAPPNWMFDIVVYDTTGAVNYSPGNPVAEIDSQIAYNVGTPYGAITWYDFNSITSIPVLRSGSYYIGLRWLALSAPVYSIRVDESVTTPMQPAYEKIGNQPWQLIRTYTYNYRALGIRADGYYEVLAHDYETGPFLSLPGSFTVGQSYDIKARIKNLGSSNETGVPIKFSVDGIEQNSVNLSLDTAETDSVSFPWVALGGYHTLRIYSALESDLYRGNDTVAVSVFAPYSIPTPGGTITVCRQGLNLPIQDFIRLNDSVQVILPSWAFGVQDVNAYIDTVLHTYDSDLSFTLSHEGISSQIISYVGSSGQDFIHTMLNDSASTPIWTGSAPFSGEFMPSNPLGVFNGTNVNPDGYWKLEIYDRGSEDTGVLKAWCLTINYFTYIGGIGTITVPNYYALGQNYPNPFNPLTKIEFAIPRPGDVKIVVYDILGKETAVLVNEFKNPGIYTVDFDGSKLSSGVYLYKMQAGDFTDTKKMLLIK
jgi:hypothetical protein